MLSVITIVLINCKMNQKQINFITPPYKNLDIQPDVFTVSADNSSEIKLQNGGSIVIPENAFVDENNEPVKGTVEIKFREFHNAADIILSDMPMDYDSAGEKLHFETAGMFEINGYQNNNPIFVASGKNITVNLGSYARGNDYNFYELDKEKKSWVYRGGAPSKINEEKKLLTEELMAGELKKPVMPKRISDNSQLVNLNINYKLYPELEQFHGIMWEYSGNASSMNPKKNQWIYKTKWNSMSLTEYSRDSCKYLLSLSTKDKSFKTIITPVLSKKNYAKELKKFEKKLEAFNTKIKEIEDKRQREEREADLIRTLTVNGFGIYNCDRVMRQPNAVAMKANFKIDAPVDMDDVTVYLVSSNDRSVIEYNKYNNNSFKVSPDVDNCLIVLLPDQKVARFSNADFRKINYDSLRALDEYPSYTFHLKMVSKPISSKASLQEILKSI